MALLQVLKKLAPRHGLLCHGAGGWVCFAFCFLHLLCVFCKTNYSVWKTVGIQRLLPRGAGQLGPPGSRQATTGWETFPVQAWSWVRPW